MYYYDVGINAYIYYYDTHFIDEEAKEEEMTYPNVPCCTDGKYKS